MESQEGTDETVASEVETTTFEISLISLNSGYNKELVLTILYQILFNNKIEY